MNISKILVPIDFSECSFSALQHAVALAKRLSAEIHVLHAWETPPYLTPEARVYTGGRDQLLSEFISTEAGQAMKRFLSAYDGDPTVKILARIDAGEPVKTILRAAEEGYDLLVLGTHGRRGLAHLMLGSVAEKVARRARCPVLTVRQPKSAAV